jgi:hypothetical protein
MHNISVCNTTQELYFHVQCHHGDVEHQMDGFMPQLKLGDISPTVQVIPYHMIIGMESIVVHRLPGSDAVLLVRC